MDEKQLFRTGVKDGIPIFLGYFSVSFAFGIFAVTKGLAVWEAVVMSMCNVTSAGQLAAVPLIVAGSGFLELAATQCVINLRYSLMSITLSQRFSEKVRLIDRFWIAFMVTDEIFGVAVAKPEKVGRKYMFGLASLPFVGWAAGTALGALAGNIFPDMVTSALGVAIYGMFVAICMPVAKKDARVALCILLAVAIGCAFYYLPGLRVLQEDYSGLTLIISAVTASVVFAIVDVVRDKDKEAAA